MKAYELNGLSRAPWGQGFDSVDADTLMNSPLPQSQFLVEGLIPQGVHIMCGSSKIGKRWLMLELALKLAIGEPFWGMETAKCGVLYLSLEDTLKRIQDRLMKLTDEAPPELRFAVTATTIGNGLEKDIAYFMSSYPETKLIIIDTFQRIRSPKNAGGSVYANDYDDITALKKISADLGVSIILVQHLRKQKDADPFNQVSGSSGIVGAADSTFILQKGSRESNAALLSAVGRDIEMQQLYLEFSSLRWNLVERKDSAAIIREKAPQFLFKLIDFMRERDEWSGTATELLCALGDTITPPVIVKNAIVEFYYDVLKPAGIDFESKKTNKARLLTFRKSDAVTGGDGKYGICK